MPSILIIERRIVIKGYIYKIINSENELIYIGRTKNTPLSRFNEHCKDAFLQNRKAYFRKLESAIREIGKDKFAFEIVEEITSDNESKLIRILDKREKYWIEILDTVNNGYNESVGGSGKSFLSNAEKLKIFKLYIEDKKTIIDIVKETNHCYDVISNLLKSAGIDTNINKNLSNNEFKKRILQIDKNSGEVINIFESISDAARYISNDKSNSKLKSIRTNISRCISGKNKTSNGYIWKIAE